LASSGWTRPERIAISGRSNGGLLVGATITQHPELFGAALAEVGVMDMLRFERFTIGWGWTSDYGSVDDPDQFRTLLGYSPLHNIRPGTAYPPTLVTTGDHDDRVVPGHSFKFAAALQAAQHGEAPVLIRIDTDAGHGMGKPVGKLIDERADVLAFLELALAAEPATGPEAGSSRAASRTFPGGSPPGFEIRRARPEDAAAVGEVCLTSFKATFDFPSAHPDDAVRRWIREEIVPREETFVAVEPDGTIAGFMSLHENDLEQLYVRPDRFDRGIGSRFVDLAKERRPGGIGLYAFQANARARAFYERRGFRVERLGNGESNEERQPDMRYEWRPDLDRA
ncbi:MAG: GNAT family N-acetyltransferase, partial [Candidatus Limnocylindrales bacterium]